MAKTDRFLMTNIFKKVQICNGVSENQKPDRPAVCMYNIQDIWLATKHGMFTQSYQYIGKPKAKLDHL